MGGNVFENTRRISLQEYESLSFDLKHFYKDNYDLTLLFPEQVKEKYSFGDLDVFIYSDLQPIIHSVNNYSQFSKNGDVLSVLYEDVQIDFTSLKGNVFGVWYYAYEDTTGLIGQLVKSVDKNLKLNHKGLHYRAVGYNYEHLISNNPEDIFYLLDLDYKKYKQGFNTYTELFDWFTSSSLFDPSHFHLDNLSNENRHRNSKRKFYLKFLEYFDTKDFVKVDNLDSSDKLNVLSSLCFVHAQEVERLRKLDLDCKSKFNGKHISELTGYTNKQLGDFMAYVKSYYPKHLISFLSQQDLDQIVLFLKGLYESK